MRANSGAGVGESNRLEPRGEDGAEGASPESHHPFILDAVTLLARTPMDGWQRFRPGAESKRADCPVGCLLWRRQFLSTVALAQLLAWSGTASPGTGATQILTTSPTAGQSRLM